MVSPLFYLVWKNRCEQVSTHSLARTHMSSSKLTPFFFCFLGCSKLFLATGLAQVHCVNAMTGLHKCRIWYCSKSFSALPAPK